MYPRFASIAIAERKNTHEKQNREEEDKEKGGKEVEAAIDTATFRDGPSLYFELVAE